ncbi:GNAT family N-acetyltransferase [Streptomyces sp. NPDC088785]|uniref:GNAT family N-acetyltransferase n=1 Tax=Streptomyces sp. NPDC088785 TaxID=3365897 RepID=UPI0038059E32
MLRGERIGLRARHEDDIPVLEAGLYADVATTARADSSPWRPLTPGSPESRFRVADEDRDHLAFSVVELAGGALVGGATLWGVDLHHRCAHIGLGLLPAARGKGYATDVVGALCHYAFVVRGLHRLQIETLADNTPMIRCAERNGFVREGVLRSAAWVMGAFHDDVVLGLLAGEWHPPPRP